MKTVVIFGGSGFVGQHIVRKIAKYGYKIIIPYQQQVNEAKVRLLGTTGQIVFVRFRSINEPIITNQIENADVIINLKTIWDEKKITFQKGILDFNISLVNMLKKNQKNYKFIYFSGLGVDLDFDSKRSVAIFESENYIKQNLKNTVIIRPCIIIGGGDRFLKGLLKFFRMSFVIPLFGNGESKFQPVYIDDLSVALCKIIEDTFIGNQIFEITGSKIFTYKEFYNFIAKCLGYRRVFVPIPFVIAKFGVFFLEKTPFSPINLEQLKLFKVDNIASLKHKKLSDLGIKPQDLREIIKKIVKKNS